MEFQKKKRALFSASTSTLHLRPLHLHPLNHAVIYIVLTMDAVPCLDLTPPYQVASAQLTLLENDAKKVNAEDTWGVELFLWTYRLS